MRLAIVRPKENAPEALKRAFKNVRPGSACVAIMRDSGYGWIYYEGGIYSRAEGVEPTKEQRNEYAVIAAGRATEKYPTTAFFAFPTEEALTNLEVIGEVEGRYTYFYGDDGDIDSIRARSFLQTLGEFEERHRSGGAKTPANKTPM